MSVTVEIDGVGEVQFDDSFKDLTREQQQRLVNRIADERATLENKKKRKEEDDGYLANLARTAVGQGALLGFGDEVEAGLRTGFGLLGDYGATRDEIRGQVKDFAAENPATALAAEIGGGLLTGGVGGARAAGTAIGRKVLEKAGTAGLAAGIGATEGAIAGVGSGETAGERLAGGAVGATLGGALGAAAPAAIGAVKAGVGRVRSGVSDKAAQEAADLKALQSIEEGGMSPEDVLRGLDETRASGVTDAMIPDIAGDATRGLARGASTVSGEGRVIAQKALDERAANMGDEIANDVGNVLAGGKSASEALDEIATRQAANAGNDYDAAFNVDGAPVTVEVTDQLKRFFALPGFEEAVEQARNLAKFDGVEIPSADDLIKGGRIDDLSLQELHYVKMGLDEVMGLGKRGQSKTSIGRGTERKLKEARAEFVGIIDDASPQIDGESAYKTARNKFAGDARLREAIEDGEGFFRMKPDELEAKVSKMSDSEKEAFRIGVAQAVRNSVDSTADLADAGKKIFGNKKQRKLLRAAFPDDKTFEAFEKRMEARIEQVITRGYAPRSGSPTALRDQDVSNLSETADAVTSMLMGNPLPAARSALGQVTDRASTSGRVGRALSQDLFSTDPAAQREFLERLARRRAAEQARMARAGRLAGGYGGTAGVFGGLLTGER
mgnify:FL=1